ncbi:MAG TPA: hypothetical protein VGO61_13755 [Steroidobacteraceae bacterium]|nr:hypothetical protein [Steroidobacteraceae bacterium]
MLNRIGFVAGLVLCAALTASPVWADDPLRNLVDQRVPVLRDGTTMSQADVEQAILAACKRYNYEVIAASPGVISARWVRGKLSFDVSIPYAADRYSILYLDSVNMDYNPAKQRIHHAYNGYVNGLAAHVRAQLALITDRMKAERKQQRAAATSATN